MSAGSEEFLRALDEVRDLHLSKTKDYGDSEDPLQNIRYGAAVINVPAWMACVIRIADKVSRVKAFCRNGRIEHDGMLDTFRDIAAYSLIARVLFEEANGTNDYAAAGEGEVGTHGHSGPGKPGW